MNDSNKQDMRSDANDSFGISRRQLLAQAMIAGATYAAASIKGSSSEAAEPDGMASNVPAAQCAAFENDQATGFHNGLVSVAFDKQSGTLVSLKNLATGDEYLKELSRDGNPFRAYVDTTEVPLVLTQSFPYPIPPVEDALGGTLVDPKKCRLDEASFSRGGNAGILHLVSRHEALKLTFDLVATLPDNDVAIELQLTIKNSDTTAHRLMTAMPYLTGLALGNDRSKNLGVSLVTFGQAGGAAWANSGEIYGRVWTGQWNAVYDAASGQGLGLIVKDKEMNGKLFRRFPGGGMSVLNFNDFELKPDASITFPTVQILVNQGDWKLTARRYRQWFQSTFIARNAPAWLDDVNMFVGSWIPSVQAVAEAKRDPGKPGAFTSFRQLDRLYLDQNPNEDNGGPSDQYDLKELAMYWNLEALECHCDGLFEFREDLGGQEAFRDGVVRVEKIGRHVGLYVATQSMRVDSPFFTKVFAGAKPQDWLLMDTKDTKISDTDPDGKQWFFCCLRYAPWQDYLAGLCKTLLKESGAKYVRLDEAGAAFLVCHNPAHHHASPYLATGEMLAFYRKVRQAADEVNPDIVIFTENPTDPLRLYCEGSLAMWNAGSNIAPMRLANPSYVGFSYALGQIESALQGYVPRGPGACSTSGWANGHHETLWGPGLVARPKSYPKNENDAGSNLRWHELRRTFIDAVNRCDPTDVDPIGLGQNPGEWSARLWRADKYWLMVCGNVAGLRPQNPVRVKLSELPVSVKSAYEFDTATLVMRETRVNRDNTGIHVDVTSGFAAVLFPLAGCAAYIQIDDPQTLHAGQAIQLDLSAFAPWRANAAPVEVTASAPGLKVSPEKLALPGTITISMPQDAEPGSYYFQITGPDNLPARRWMEYNQ